MNTLRLPATLQSSTTPTSYLNATLHHSSHPHTPAGPKFHVEHYADNYLFIINFHLIYFDIKMNMLCFVCIVFTYRVVSYHITPFRWLRMECLFFGNEFLNSDIFTGKLIYTGIRLMEWSAPLWKQEVLRKEVLSSFLF